MDPQETKEAVGETAAVRRSGGGRSNRSNVITPATCASLGSSLVVRRAVAKNVVGGGVSGNANWLCSAGSRAQLGMHADSARQVSSRRAGSRFALWQQHTPARLQHANAQARSPRLSTGSRLARSGANSANNPSWTNAKHKARDNRRGSVHALVHRTTDLHQEFSRLVPRSCIVLGIQRNTQASSPGYSLRIEAASLRRLSLRGPHLLGETYSTPERFHNSLVYRSKPTIFSPTAPSRKRRKRSLGPLLPPGDHHSESRPHSKRRSRVISLQGRCRGGLAVVARTGPLCSYRLSPP